MSKVKAVKNVEEPVEHKEVVAEPEAEEPDMLDIVNQDVGGAVSEEDVAEDDDDEGDEDDEDLDDEEGDLAETFAMFWERMSEQAETLEVQGKRIESMDRTLFFGLRGLVMLIDQMETAVNPLSDPGKKAEALAKVRQTINMMKENLK